MRSGYHNIGLLEETQKNFAFITQMGNYESKIGLTQAPAYFQ